jgi:predicted O-methyltransferase YrrM
MFRKIVRQIFPVSAPRSWRPEWLPRQFPLQSEGIVHSHVPEERAGEFLAFNTGSTEIEVLNWLHATICLTKSRCVLETGAANGLGTIAFASACRANGAGKVHSVEFDPGLCQKLADTLRRNDLDDFAEVHCADSLAFLRDTSLVFDFAFFDSMCEIRADEYTLCVKRNILSGPAVFHDTSPWRTQTMKSHPVESLHSEYRRALYAHAQDARNTGYFESTLSRGLFVIFPRRAPRVASPR